MQTAATTETPTPTSTPAAPAAAVANTLATIPAAPAVDAKAIADQAVAQERARLSALDALATDWPEHKALIDRCKADGTSIVDAKDTVLAAEGKIKQARLAVLRGGSPATEPMASGNADTVPSGAFSAEAVKQRFASDSAFAAKYRTEEEAIEWERAKHEAAQDKPRR